MCCKHWIVLPKNTTRNTSSTRVLITSNIKRHGSIVIFHGHRDLVKLACPGDWHIIFTNELFLDFTSILFSKAWRSSAPTFASLKRRSVWSKDAGHSGLAFLLAHTWNPSISRLSIKMEFILGVAEDSSPSSSSLLQKNVLTRILAVVVKCATANQSVAKQKTIFYLFSTPSMTMCFISNIQKWWVQVENPDYSSHLQQEIRFVDRLGKRKNYHIHIWHSKRVRERESVRDSWQAAMIHPYPLAKTNTNFTPRITLAKSLFAVLIQCSSNKDIPRALPSSQCSAASPLSCVDPPCCAIAQTHFAKAMPWHPQHMKHHYCSALFPTPWFPFFFPNMAALLSLALSLKRRKCEDYKSLFHWKQWRKRDFILTASTTWACPSACTTLSNVLIRNVTCPCPRIISSHNS